MNRLQAYVVLCYSIPVFGVVFLLGLILSYFCAILGWDKTSNQINNRLAYLWMWWFFGMTGRTVQWHSNGWKPDSKNRFLICNHTNAIEVPLFVSLPGFVQNWDLKLSYLGGDIIQRYKIIPLMMHARIVEAVIYSEKKPNFRNFKSQVLKVLETRSIFLYPEGERTYTEEVRPFQTGVLKIAYKFEIDLDVFVVHGAMGYSSLPEYDKERKSQKIDFAYCGTVLAKDHADFSSYLAKAEDLMKAEKAKFK